MTLPRSRVVLADGAALELRRHGSGEPVLLVQTALTAGELLPVAERLDRAGRYDVLVPLRRGYGSSSPARRPGSVVDDANDAVAVLDALGVDRAHVVGVSYSAAVALELATRRPERVATLTLVEPPPTLLPDHRDFDDACEEWVAAAAHDGVARALDGS